MKHIELGDAVTDTITGYSGIVTAVCRNLHSCDKILVERIHPEGNVLEIWFNVGRLKATATEGV